MEAYCLKCREKREILNPIADFNKRGAPVTHGTCVVCGSKIVRTGNTDLHSGMEKPVSKLEKGNNRKGKLVIVESPAKAKTVGNILGKEYQVRASIGHIRDLLRSQLSVDIENEFSPKYRVPNDKRKIVKELKKIVEKAEEVYLATDPDREGEAIAWHIKEATNLEEQYLKRVVFHEITKPAIEEAFRNPREIDMDLVNAQQARRILDRLVGYNLSPLLWQKVRSRLSAGRVQSVVLRLIVEREREIEVFIPKEYWTIDAELRPEENAQTFIARLIKINGEEPSLPTSMGVEEIKEKLEKSKFVILKIKKGERRRKPYAPFITSTLQQQASRQLGFSAKKTMSIAQQLYEGVEINHGETIGLITYMRTDSTYISPVAITDVRDYIKKRYGDEYLPEQAIQYRKKVPAAQEAHEAIRPTSILRVSQEIKENLSKDQYRLYDLIWKRFVSSQMESAIYNTIAVDVEGKNLEDTFLLRASGSSIQFQGFLLLYEEAKEENIENGESQSLSIPDNLTEGQEQQLVQLICDQHFTQPPPRYTEALLIQILEEYGIGRPSTYAPIISTILTRGYVERDAKKLIPTDVGLLVNDLLVDYFPDFIEVHFTALMEQNLDEIANGKKVWIDVLKEFYSSFEPKLRSAQEQMPEMKTDPEKTGELCPECGSELIFKWGRYGKFICCSNYPECRFTKPYLERIGVLCPKDGANIVERKTRKGRIFYGCENYPNCDFSSWKRPINAICPECKGLLVQKNKNEAQCLDCGESFSLDRINIEKETA